MSPPWKTVTQLGPAVLPESSPAWVWFPSKGAFLTSLFCLLKICDAISKWEQALKELHSGKSEGGTRVVKLMYKNRSGHWPRGGPSLRAATGCTGRSPPERAPHGAHRLEPGPLGSSGSRAACAHAQTHTPRTQTSLIRWPCALS